jgi:serine/threonine-protein kinase HipA
LKTNIFVFAHWIGMIEPKLIGILTAQRAKAKKVFSFEYAANWIQTNEQMLLDPDIGWYSGQQFPNGKENFGVFFDSMPDTWGRTLMKRRAMEEAKENGIKAETLYDIDFLLGVYDEGRMGALRFKLEIDGPFLDNHPNSTIPPMSSIRALQQAALKLESDSDSKKLKKWLKLIMAPGSSLGGARPKANIIDEKGELWIAKFPSKNDTFDKGAWEYLAYQLALKAGVEISESRIEKISGKHFTFFTKRFDRLKNQRIHFASAMTMTGFNEEILKENTASYLDIAEFIQYKGVQNTKDLHQLWRRIVFNIAISNTDDHLRNHGFILNRKGWMLSPAYDLNPSIDKDGLALNIDAEQNDLDFDLAISVGHYFQLSPNEMKPILNEINIAISKWKKIAKTIGISRNEQEMMAPAFRIWK